MAIAKVFESLLTNCNDFEYLRRMVDDVAKTEDDGFDLIHTVGTSLGIHYDLSLALMGELCAQISKNRELEAQLSAVGASSDMVLLPH